MEIRGLAFLPILCFIWTILGICALIALTIISGHSDFPYISDTGVAFPESVIYTVIFIANSVLGAGIAYIQYRFMIIQSEPSEKRYIICQKILLIIGWIVCIANIVNAVFSVKINPTAHRIGAGMAFLLLDIYNISQAVYLYKRSFSSRCMCHFRLAATLLTTVLLLITGAGMCTYFFHLCSGLCKTIFFRTGMIAEWIGFIGLIMYQLTNYTDFQSLSLKISREGVTICLREKIQAFKMPV
ncbi:DNA damage-regulated autophagy modulator protein 1-like [Ranitomeya variabilis]|uniref:DNA damage-regulated autophagy modulator protein 1-like n=1 Tax=Ranitomeya variabilis TaxID=490064 RepID=UPI0040562DDF